MKFNQRKLSKAARKEILELNNYECAYCFSPADTVDHIIPFSHRHDDSYNNLAACCSLCNCLAGNKVFKTFEEKKDWLLERREFYFSKRVIVLWLKEELGDLGASLRSEIKSNSIVIDSVEELLRVKCLLIEDGLKVKTCLD